MTRSCATAESAFLHGHSADEAMDLLSRALEIGVRFKASGDMYRDRADPRTLRDALLVPLPHRPMPTREVIGRFEMDVLPYCKNEASPRFMGFADTGSDVAALVGELLSVLVQQNLINQSFDSPTATFVEICVLRWMRELLGYPVADVAEVSSVWDVGGIVTSGGTMSNAVAMMLAREHHDPGTAAAGVRPERAGCVLVPEGIGHYSVRASLSWLGLGDRVVPVPTSGFRYDLSALRRVLRERSDEVAGVVAYAGDSRTQTIERLRAVSDLVREFSPGSWLHADACWGLAAALHHGLRGRLAGIETFDSITVDPHKVLNVPYSLSALLVREPQSLRSITSYADLIMQEEWAFGQVTPFLGSKPWWSLKLWMLMLRHGREGLHQIIERRSATLRSFTDAVDAQPSLVRLHEPDLFALAFMYVPPGEISTPADVVRLNLINEEIHDRLLEERSWFFHQFGLPDAHGVISRGAVLRPLRFVAGNPGTTDDHIRQAVARVVELGDLISGRRA